MMKLKINEACTNMNSFFSVSHIVKPCFQYQFKIPSEDRIENQYVLYIFTVFFSESFCLATYTVSIKDSW